MHKRIVEVLEVFFEKSPYAENAEVYVQQTNTDGFWKMVVRFEKAEMAGYLKSTVLAIGHGMGEGLDVRTEGHFLQIS